MSRGGRKAGHVLTEAPRTPPMFTTEQLAALRTWVRAEITAALGIALKVDNKIQLLAIADALYERLPKVLTRRG